MGSLGSLGLSERMKILNNTTQKAAVVVWKSKITPGLCFAHFYFPAQRDDQPYRGPQVELNPGTDSHLSHRTQYLKLVHGVADVENV